MLKDENKCYQMVTVKKLTNINRVLPMLMLQSQGDCLISVSFVSTCVLYNTVEARCYIIQITLSYLFGGTDYCMWV